MLSDMEIILVIYPFCMSIYPVWQAGCSCSSQPAEATVEQQESHVIFAKPTSMLSLHASYPSSTNSGEATLKLVGAQCTHKNLENQY